MAGESRQRQGKRCAASADPLPAPSSVLLDDQGCAYRVLESEPVAAVDELDRLLVLVEVLGPRTRQLSRSHGLTKREVHIATLLARRATNAEIAEELEISPHTARHHTEHVMTKLGVRSRDAVRALLFDGWNSARRS